MMGQNGEYAGDSNRLTRKYFDSLLVEMRHLDAITPDTTMTMFGESFQTPIMMAALSHLSSMVQENGAALMAAGAASQGSCMWTGMGDETELDAIATTGAKFVKIIKPYADRDSVYRKIEYAVKCGALAVGMDIDHQFAGNGRYDKVFGLEMRPVSSDELHDFVKFAKIPFIVKGVLSEQDTQKCLDAGVRGIVVSHHHGIMPYAVPPLFMLPKIKQVICEYDLRNPSQAVDDSTKETLLHEQISPAKSCNHKDDRMKVFVDCGIENGMDVYKALSLGADAVCVGRAMMEALRANGTQGVQDKIKQMTEELAGAMARTAIHDLSQMDPGVIHHHLI
jgi:isopentenyl diphosphate isomerase/L-lactate dehydrogenase-like FMN-dependent dehydrogenase